MIMTDEIVGHLSEKVELPDPASLEIVSRQRPTVPPSDYLPYQMTASDIPPMANFGEGYRYHVTGLAHDETGSPTNDPAQIEQQILRINRKIERYRDQIVEVEEFETQDMEILVIAYGATARSAKKAVSLAREAGLKAGLLKLKTLWPFADIEIEALAKSVNKIIVPELNLGQIAHEVEWTVRRAKPVIRVNRINGEPITPAEILAAIKN